jgi:hypothetical protein
MNDKMHCPNADNGEGCKQCYHSELGHEFKPGYCDDHRDGCGCVPYIDVKKIYLASRFSNRFMLRRVRARLAELGYKSTARWISHHSRPKNPKVVEQQWKDAFAKEDIEDMDKADMIIVCTIGCEQDPPRGGMRFEEGYFYGKGKPILLVGPRIFIFDFLSDIPVVKDWRDCYLWLKKYHSRKGRK